MIVEKNYEGPSKLLARKWKQQNMNIHKQKLAEAKSLISTGVISNRPQPTINKTKNDLLEEEKFTEIERENRILYEKISKINMKGNAFSNSG